MRSIYHHWCQYISITPAIDTLIYEALNPLGFPRSIYLPTYLEVTPPHPTQPQHNVHRVPCPGRGVEVPVEVCVRGGGGGWEGGGDPLVSISLIADRQW